MSKEVYLVEFDYTCGEACHYCSIVLMTKKQAKEVEAKLLRVAANGEEIDNIYVGPPSTPIPFEEFKADCPWMDDDETE